MRVARRAAPRAARLDSGSNLADTRVVMQSCRRPPIAFRAARALAIAVLAIVAVCPRPAGAAGDRPWTVAPPAPWVRELALPTQLGAPKTGTTSGKVYRLVDHQVRVGDTTVEYNRLAWTVLSTEGVQNASEIQIDFDPAYEHLVIHHVRLLRNGRDVFSFRPSDVRVIQPETSLDEQIYSGELTAVVFLRDLRPGDTLDYAYSLEGANPILAGAYDDVLWLQYAAPVERLRHVVSLPAGVPLHVTPLNTALTPLVATVGKWRWYTWEARDVPAQVIDEDEPDWFDPDPRVQLSTFESWAAVAEWARALFESQAGPSPDIKRLADGWRASPGGPIASAGEATRFVQDEVRYLGIEMGPNSYQPHPPAQVLRQRFGDCKDKALLLVALLRELGIDAAPALVNTTRRRGLDEEPPSAFAFDHAIVRATIGGRTLWIDATESAKGGPIEDWDAPDFERALVLAPGTGGLAVIEQRARPEPLIEVKETYTLGDASQPTRLDVITTYRRGEADDMRRTLATTPQQDLAKEYLDYFAREFADIKALGPPTSRDDRARNVVTVAESYELAAFWKKGERELHGWQVRAQLPKSAASTRTTPLAVPYPAHVVHRLVVRARRSFRVRARHAAISDEAFEFSSDVAANDGEMRVTYDYRSRADSVPPEKIKAHQQAVERLKDELSFVLTSNLTEAGVGGAAIPWIPIGLAGVGLLVVGTVAAVLRVRRRRVGVTP